MADVSDDESAAIICPHCSARLPLGMTLSRSLQSVDGPARAYIDLSATDLDAIERHAETCGGPSGDGGEPLPKPMSA